MTASWTNYIEKNNGKIGIDTESRPQNESEKHFFKKIVLADAISDLGNNNIKTEDSRKFKGVRFDISGEIPGHGQVAAEIGNFNCRSRDLKARLRTSYEAGCDFLFWWPKQSITNYTNIMNDVLPTAETAYCPHCEERMPWFHNANDLFNLQMPKNYVTAGIYGINLFHMFEPSKFHYELEQQKSSNHQSTMQDFFYHE